MAKSEVVKYTRGGSIVTSGRIMVGRTADKTMFGVAHTIRGKPILSTLGTGTGKKGEAVGQTKKGSFSRKEMAKSIRGVRKYTNAQLDAQSRNDVVRAVRQSRQRRDARGRFA